MKSLLLVFVSLTLSNLVIGAITGYSNTLSTTKAAATAVKSTYAFTPTSGSSSAFNIIEITNQPFTAASSSLTASCTNCVKNPQITLSKAVGSGTATIAFTTMNEIPNSGIITLTFPAATVTGSTAPVCSSSPSTTFATQALASGVIKLTLGSSATLAAGAITLTCTTLTLAASAAVTASSSAGLKIETSVDTEAVRVNIPAVAAVALVPVSHSAFSASFTSNTLTITSSSNVWTLSSSPVIECIVESFTNPAIQAATSNVGLTTKLASSTIESVSGQAFPAITATDTGTVPATTAAPSKSFSKAVSLSAAVILSFILTTLI